MMSLTSIWPPGLAFIGFSPSTTISSMYDAFNVRQFHCTSFLPYVKSAVAWLRSYRLAKQAQLLGAAPRGELGDRPPDKSERRKEPQKPVETKVDWR